MTLKTIGTSLVKWLIVLSCIFLLVSQNSKYYVVQNLEIYLFFLTFFVFAFFGGSLTDVKNKKISLFLFLSSFLFLLFTCVIHFERPFVTTVYEIVFGSLFILMRYECRDWIYDKFIKIISLLFFLGICEYALMNIGIDFIWGTYEREQMEFYQGIFTSVPVYYKEVPARFHAFCDEPGTVGTIAFFILATIDRNKYKKEFYITLVAGVLSFSMAFYLLGALYLIFNFRKYLFSIKSIVIIILLSLVAYFTLAEFLDQRVFQRINSKDAIETLDNRNSDVVNKKFDTFIKSSDCVFGLGHRTYYDWKKKTDNISVGLKEQVFMYGIFGVSIMVLIFSSVFLRYNGKKKKNIVMLTLFWISFYQRSYWLFPPLIILLFSNKNTYENRSLNIS